MTRVLLPALVLLVVGCSREPDPASTPDPIRPGGTPMGQPVEGEIATPQEFAKQADVPLYPKSKMPENASNTRKDGKEVRYEVVMTTPDSPEKALAFYKEKFPKGQQIGKQWMGMTQKGAFASVTAEREEKLTRITVVVRATE